MSPPSAPGEPGSPSKTRPVLVLQLRHRLSVGPRIFPRVRAPICKATDLVGLFLFSPFPFHPFVLGQVFGLRAPSRARERRTRYKPQGLQRFPVSLLRLCLVHPSLCPILVTFPARLEYMAFEPSMPSSSPFCLNHFHLSVFCPCHLRQEPGTPLRYIYTTAARPTTSLGRP